MKDMKVIRSGLSYMYNVVVVMPLSRSRSEDKYCRHLSFSPLPMPFLQQTTISK